jgi:hypothetical protein
MLRRHLGRAEQAAPLTHLGCGKGFKHIHRFRAADRDQKAVVFDSYAGLGCQFRPDIARPPGTAPALTRLLACHRDKTKVPHRSPDGLGLAVYYGHCQSEPTRRERMGKANDAGPDHNNIKMISHLCQFASLALEF